jgi:hypothetical protein
MLINAFTLEEVETICEILVSYLSDLVHTVQSDTNKFVRECCETDLPTPKVKNEVTNPIQIAWIIMKFDNKFDDI